MKATDTTACADILLVEPFVQVHPADVSALGLTHGALAEAGIEPSVGRVRNSYDNVLAEAFIGLYKTD